MNTLTISPSTVEPAKIPSASPGHGNGLPALPANSGETGDWADGGKFSDELQKHTRDDAGNVVMDIKESGHEAESSELIIADLLDTGNVLPDGGEVLPSGLSEQIEAMGPEYKPLSGLESSEQPEFLATSDPQLPGTGETVSQVSRLADPVIKTDGGNMTHMAAPSPNPTNNSGVARPGLSKGVEGSISGASPVASAVLSALNEGNRLGGFVAGKSIFTHEGEHLPGSPSRVMPSMTGTPAVTSSEGKLSEDISSIMTSNQKKIEGMINPSMSSAASMTEGELAELSRPASSRISALAPLTPGISTPAANSIVRSEFVTPTPTIPLASGAPFGTQGWSDAVASRVIWLTDNRMMTAELRLDPPDLGPLQVKISMADGQAQVSFVSQSSDVRNAIDQSVARLRELFEERNVDLMNVDISDQSATDRDTPDQQLPASNSSEHASGDGLLESNEDGELSRPYENLPQSVGLVDYYV